ncbi:MAG: N-acetylmuramidase family protein [Anaerolineae bacterium]|nr:N-acetylmuramidase family protein [Thermoflexales bacterium]MDW8408156.1 N-acetylmuramidase family protein [Anaerolineae bacterium]
MASNPNAYVTPKAGSGGVNLRSQPFIDPTTRIGFLPEGARLALEEAGADWHAGRVYVSTQFAQAIGDSFVTLRPGAISVNVRSAPVLSDTTDVGDLVAGQRLELIQRVGDWLLARAYVSAQFTDVMVDTPPGPKPPTPTTPPGLLTPDQVRALPLTPAQPRTVPPGLNQNQIRAARIWNQYGGLLEPLAASIGIEPAVAVAVVAVESGGRGFGADGRMIIRFENHVFWSLWGRNNATAFNALFTFNSDVTWQGHKFRVNPNAPWQDVHTGNQSSEWDAFNVAATLNANAAKRSISMGLPQIMGFNHQRIGYDTVEAMFDAFSADERWQVLGMFAFIVSNPALPAALRQGDFVAFARGYNGPAQANFYANLIAAVRDAFLTLPVSKSLALPMSLGLPAMAQSGGTPRREKSRSGKRK